MYEEKIINSRPDREITKKLVTQGDYNLVPYEDSRCKVVLTNVKFTNDSGDCPIDEDSRIFSKKFDGNVLIGDSDYFVDLDFELILQQMCKGETCNAKIVYKDDEGTFVKELSCTIELVDVTEEQLISEWGWMRLFEAACHHKENGVELVKQKRITDAFRRFSKSLKMLIAVEPIDPNNIPEENVQEMIDLKVKLYNNLAHCQLQYNQNEQALELCNKALQFDPDNTKSLYRRCTAYIGLNMFEEAWKDIQEVLRANPNDKAAQCKAALLKPKIENILKNYNQVIKKMFV